MNRACSLYRNKGSGVRLQSTGERCGVYANSLKEGRDMSSEHRTKYNLKKKRNECERDLFYDLSNSLDSERNRHTADTPLQRCTSSDDL